MKHTCDTPGYKCKYASLPSNQEPCKSCDGESAWTPDSTEPRRLASKADTGLAEYFASGRATEAEMRYYMGTGTGIRGG